MKNFTFLEYSGFFHMDSLNTDTSKMNLHTSDLKMLSHLSRTLVPSKTIFDLRDNYISAQSIVGVFSFNNVRIEIFPKLLKTRNCKTDSWDKVVSNLMFMLSYTDKLEVLDSGNSEMSSTSASFIEAYISIFANRLERHLIRYGMPKSYVLISENLNTIKGRINFAENARINPFDESKVFCEFSEFSVNNQSSQAYKYISLALRNLTSNPTTLSKLNRCVGLLDGVSATYIAPEDFLRHNFGKRDKNYISLSNLAAMFLKKLRPEIQGKTNSTVFSILFDMNELFEEFIFRILKVNEQRLGIKVYSQRKKKLVSAERNLSNSGVWEERNLFDTFTDIIVETAVGTKFIIDTKYKMISTDKSHYGINNQDAYQVLAYGQIHNRDGNSPKVVLLFPKNHEDIHREFRVNSSESTFIAWTIDISRDLSKNIDNLVRDLETLIKAAS